MSFESNPTEGGRREAEREPAFDFERQKAMRRESVQRIKEQLERHAIQEGTEIVVFLKKDRISELARNLPEQVKGIFGDVNEHGFLMKRKESGGIPIAVPVEDIDFVASDAPR